MFAASNAGNTAQAAEQKDNTMKIRFYTGNLSVGYFMDYWGTGKILPYDVPTQEWCKQMKGVSVVSVCDYLGWCRIESEPGKFDWSFYDNNQKILSENGLTYNVFCWLHFAPHWFAKTPDYTPYKCVEHDLPIQQTSLWAPGTLKVYDRYYKELAAHFGSKIEFIRLATPSEYGEIGYPLGMTTWLVKQDHAHEGYWCNDVYARADFKKQMMKKYKNIDSINVKWGTSFASPDAIEFPDITRDRKNFIDPLKMTPQKRRWILDFIGWYYDSQSRFVRSAVSIVRKYFPKIEIIVSMGYGSQLTSFGNDDVGIAKLCKDLKISCQTPGNVDYICLKSLSTPSHYYKIPYFTEPPGGMNRNEEINRIWADASNGVQTYFDYPDNLIGAKDAFYEYRDYLDGSKSIVDTAVLFPTSDHRLRNNHWPVRTLAGVNVLREYLDYDLVDERLIQDKILRNYKVLIAYDGNILEEATLKMLKKWVSSGGILIVRDLGLVETIDGDKSLSQGLFSLVTSESSVSRTPDDIIRTASRKIGKGCVLVIPAGENDWNEFAANTSELVHNLTKYFGKKSNVPIIDGKLDGILGTLFKDRILYINRGDNEIEKTVTLRTEDFKDGRTGKPEKFDYKLVIKPHSIVQIELK